MNKLIIAKILFDKNCFKTFLNLHRNFSKSKIYKIKNMIACGLNVIKHDRLVVHDKSIIINSFIPPINSHAFYNITIQVPGKGETFFKNHYTGIRKAPISTYIAATDKCMYHCWHCSAERFMKEAKTGSQFSTKQLLYIVKQLQDLGVGIIGFTGGEPLLRQDLETVVASIKPKSVSYVFSTGFGLTYKRACSLKKAGLLGIAISLDSLDSKKHDKMRHYKDAFNIAINAIKNAKKSGIYTMSQTVATRELLYSGGLEKLALFLKKIGVDEMRIMEPLPCGRLKKHSKAVLTKQEMEKLKQFHVLFNENKIYPKTSVFPYFESVDQFGCGAGTQHSFVDAHGNFGPCDFIDKSYGNLLNENVFELWNKMHSDCGKPHSSCLAKGCSNLNCLPKFYRLMKGK